MSTIKDITELRDHQGGASVLESLLKNSRPFASVAKPEAPALDLPAIINARDLISKNPPEPPQLIKGLLHQACKMVLGGGSKSYKTWSLLDLGISVATGKPWWGFETTKAKVL